MSKNIFGVSILCKIYFIKIDKNCEKKHALKIIYFLLCKKKPVDFDGKLKIGDVRYDNTT